MSSFATFRLIVFAGLSWSLLISTVAHGAEQTSEGDGPPIGLTCVGLNVPATVHVSALVPHADELPARETPGAHSGAASGDADLSPLAHSYMWNFGDPAGRYNQLPGWNAAHVYDKPGKYIITLTVTDEAGKTTHRTSWVRVAADDRRKVYCSSAGRDDLNGATPAQAVRSAARAMQLGQTDAVILFRRGDVFDIVHQINLTGRNVHLTNYEDPSASGSASAPLPVLNKIQAPKKEDTMLFVNARCADICIDGLEFDSMFDLKQYGPAKVAARGINAGGTNCTVRDCSFRNLSDGINAELKPVGLLVEDCRFSNEIRGYGIYGCGTDHAYIGNLMLHSRQEHQIRVTEPGVTRLLIAHNEMYRANDSKGGIELRNANWFYVSDNSIDGGTMRIGPQEQDQHQYPNWASIKCTWGVVQNNRFNDIFINVRLGTEHLVVRNNLIHQRGDQEGDWAFFVACEKPGYDSVRKVVDLRIEHNTVANEGTIGQFMVVQGHALGVQLKDNLFVAPRLRTSGDRGWSVFLFDQDASGITRSTGNVWPAGPGGLFHWAKTEHGRDEWARDPGVSDERYLNVALDSDGNPPANLDAGARLEKPAPPRVAPGDGPWDKLPRRVTIAPAPQGSGKTPAR